jgi:ubiquinone biosynthesis protein UbiJ
MEASAFNTAAENLTAEEKDQLVQLLGGSSFKQIAEVATPSSVRGRTLTFTEGAVVLNLDDEVGQATVTVTVATSLDALDSGETTPAQAIARGQVRISGDASLLADAQRLLSSISARAV